MGSIWGRQIACGPHVGPMNFAFWGVSVPVLLEQESVKLNVPILVAGYVSITLAGR